MASTDGHGNPNWTREETILALELYLDCSGQIPGDTDPRVVGLSQLLRSLDLHSGEKRKATFRNPDGVAFKLQNLRNVATGKGLDNVSKMDRQVWEELGNAPSKVRELATALRQSLARTTGLVDSAAAQATIASLKPIRKFPVYQLVEEAGLDITPWRFDADGNEIAPSSNTYRNAQWGFGGGEQPTILCMWWTGFKPEGNQVILRGNNKAYRSSLGNAAAEPSRSTADKIRIGVKSGKAEATERLISEAYLKYKPVTFIVLDGKQTPEEEAPTDSSEPSARELDPTPWFVHEYDAFSGAFKFVRGIPALVRSNDAVADPADDAEFMRVLEDGALTDTEKDALTKLRVGQGWFRTQLIKRWGGCSVTGCKDESVLIASHIVPWSRCTTKSDRLNPANGLLLTPNLDRLFDRGLITFDDKFRIIFSKKLLAGTAAHLRVDLGMRLQRPDLKDCLPYLKRHREEIFQAPAQE